MKKFFTLLLAACSAVSAWALSPELLFGDTPVVPGKTYETGYTVEPINLPGSIMYKIDQNSNLFLKGVDGEPVTVEVDATSSVAVCSITGQCTSGTNVVKSGILGKADVVGRDGSDVVIDLRIDTTLSDLSGADPATLLSNVTVKVKAYYDAFPSDAVETTVVLTNKPASEVGGIADVAADGKAQIALGAPNVLNYNVAKPTKLDIYNASGALVMSRLVSASGSIALDSLHPGVYIYSANGVAGKILVRK